MSPVTDFILKHAVEDLLAWHHQVEAAERFGLSIAETEAVILDNGLLPARYQRNRQTISQGEQRKLFKSQVAVVGCGGLGCYVIEELARLGVGRIVVIDPDVFEEHNLNRQLFSSPARLGQTKVEAASRRVEEINPAVTLVPVHVALSRKNGIELLAASHVVVDSLDSIFVRMELGDVCTSLDIPLVHGAIAGWYGHVATQFPGDDTLKSIYGSWKSGKGVEQTLGNPSFTPALIASLEVAEVCKLLLGQGTPLRGRQLLIDLYSMEVNIINFLNVTREYDRSGN
ncbi:MAG: HesA/MoeB/ThiF family protein [Desulfuromonadaceae bacterium]|nr:HesA/MoeB/ThiF family protein [Desulfuromonadaceae bacterium]MDD5104954.1 HesA/MoeB/ThiF family protein [Desulfuromonadaceae bacterium]